MKNKKELLAQKLDVHPKDLNDDGSIIPYVFPVLENVYSSDELNQEFPTLADILPGDTGPADASTFIESKAGWCPGGSWDGGVCRPFNNAYRSSWMGYYQTVRNSKIQDTILPGTHNSGYDKQAQHQSNWETCQDVSPHVQLQCGIRALDLRVQFYSGYGYSDPRTFQIFHGGNSGRTIVGDIIPAAINLYSAADKEIVILDFHQFKNFTDAAHHELARVLKAWFGDKIISPAYNNLIVGQLWQLRKNVVIAYNAWPRDALFWNGVNQRWIGYNTPSSGELKAFVDKVGAETKPANELRSIQAAKYVLPFHVPDDMSGDVMSWFSSSDANSPIQKYYIVNTDWSLRHRFVDNCIHANQFRNPGLELYTSNNGRLNISAQTHISHEIDDTCWTPVVALPPPDSTIIEGQIVVVSSNSTLGWELTLDDCISPDLKSISMARDDVIVFVSVQTDEGSKWDILSDVQSPNNR